MGCHTIKLSMGQCYLRPVSEEDTSKILSLWNAPHVVGRLYMSETSEETYLRYFNEYLKKDDEWRWVVEDSEHRFVGTISLAAGTEPGDYIIGGFALFPTKAFLPVVPIVLANELAFESFNAKTISFTVLSTNRQVEKMHRLLGAEQLPESIEKIASNGKPIVLHRWVYRRNAWLANHDFVVSLGD